ncbi:MAG: N-acyl homoserine lactonase family protein [Candidatus Dormiibacterota bacterium]
MKLYLMCLATIRPGRHPVPAYLVQTDDGINALVDTGVPKALIGAHNESWETVFEMDEEVHVLNQLARIGVAPEDIRYLICTHYDVDHVGNHEDFPAAELVVQRAHHLAARSLPRFQETAMHWDAPGQRRRLVDGDTELLPGIELIECGGHVPGHQAVLVRLPETGHVLLAIDAIPHSLLVNPDTRPKQPSDMDEAGGAPKYAQVSGSRPARRRHASRARPRSWAVGRASAAARLPRLKDPGGTRGARMGRPPSGARP